MNHAHCTVGLDYWAIFYGHERVHALSGASTHESQAHTRDAGTQDLLFRYWLDHLHQRSLDGLGCNAHMMQPRPQRAYAGSRGLANHQRTGLVRRRNTATPPMASCAVSTSTWTIETTADLPSCTRSSGFVATWMRKGRLSRVMTR